MGSLGWSGPPTSDVPDLERIKKTVFGLVCIVVVVIGMEFEEFSGLSSRLVLFVRNNANFDRRGSRSVLIDRLWPRSET